ncbi:MAG: restriction endonuclease subunit R, partial [Uliginosibacterium sp.]|nr:restriction endonuclease subunit R [Uliginosibacterium sp.]
KAKVKLADGKERQIQHMMATSFWHPDGTPMSAAQFVSALYGQLPEFFKDEDELRAIWSAPDTRKRLLAGLEEKGFGHDQLAEMQKIIRREEARPFPRCAAHIAYAESPLTREERAERAKAVIGTEYSSKQQAFLSFVLAHYVSEGVEELDETKLGPLLKLKYSALPDAFADLGAPDVVRGAFVGFQRYLYEI